MHQISKIFLIFAFNCTLLSGQYSEDCKFLAGNTFQDFCRGIYPQEVAVKYHDDWIRIGETYAIYQSIARPTEFVMTFKASPLRACKRIKVNAFDNFSCVMSTQRAELWQPLSLNLTTGACFSLNLYITDDLIRVCLRQNKRSDEFAKSTKSMFQYTLKEPQPSGTTASVAVNLNWMLAVYHTSLKYLIAFAYK